MLPGRGAGQDMMNTGAGNPGDPVIDRTGRRSQADRRREMTDLLVSATLESLAVSGYHGASLNDILSRAGVSRGAWAHYFDSKAELVAVAAERMLGESVDQAGVLVAASGTLEQRLDHLLNHVWQRFYQGSRRDVLFELVIACRTDPDLRTRLQPVFQSFFVRLGQSWGLHLRPRPPGPAADAGQEPVLDVAGQEPALDVAGLITLTVYMLRGMAVQEMVDGDGAAHAGLRRLWTRLLSPHIALA